MKPSQLWFDTSHDDLRVWVDAKLQLAQAKGSSAQRAGFFRDIPLFTLAPSSAHPMGWTSFHWKDLVGKFQLDADFWISLEASRLGLLQERSEPIHAPLRVEFPFASEVVFFGGTFDPWHEGHASCINLLPAQLKLIVAPDRNPLKPLREIKNVVQLYAELVQQISSSTSRPFHVHPGFLLLTEKNPTVTWVLRTLHRRPDLRVSLLMGHDSFKSLPQWIKAQDLLKLIHCFYVVSRLENEAERIATEKHIRDLHPDISVVYLGHHPHEEKSSTALRK